MYLFLHIRISKDQFIFKNESIDNLRVWLPHVALFDLDNYSDATTIQTAIRAMEMAEKIFVQIEAEPDLELGGVLKVLNQVMKSPSVAVDYQGSHDTLNKIMIRFKDKQLRQELSLQQKVLDYFSD